MTEIFDAMNKFVREMNITHRIVIPWTKDLEYKKDYYNRSIFSVNLWTDNYLLFKTYETFKPDKKLLSQTIPT